MATVFTEDWDGVSSGTDIASSNCNYTQVKGLDATAKFDTTVQVGAKTQCAKLTTPATAVICYLEEDPITATGLRAFRRVVRLDSVPAANMVLFEARGAGVIRAQARVLTDGTLQVRNGTTAVATSSFAYSATDTIRLNWLLNNGGSTQSLQIFHGANLYGSTPDETLSGTYNQGTFDTFRQGVITAQSSMAAYFAADLDDDAANPGTPVDTGPAEAPAIAAAAQNATVTTAGGTSAIAEAATATASAQDASGSVLSSSIEWVNAAGNAANSATASVTLPILQADDLIVFGLAHVDTVTYSDPTGYTAVAAMATDGSIASRMWWKKAVAADSQATLSVPLSATTKWVLLVDVLRGAHGTTPIESSGTPTTQTGTAGNDFSVPAVNAPTAGSWLLHFVAERGSLAGTWTSPVNRSERFDMGNYTGSGQTSACIADSNGVVSTGTQASVTFTSTQAVDNRVGWTLVVAPSVTSGATSASAECATATAEVLFDPTGQSISLELSASSPIEVIASAGEVTITAVNNSGTNAAEPTGTGTAYDGQAKVTVNAELASATAVGLDVQGVNVAPTAEAATASVETSTVALPAYAEVAEARVQAWDVSTDVQDFSRALALDPSMGVAPSSEIAEAVMADASASPSVGPETELAVITAAALDATIGLILAEGSASGEDPQMSIAASAGTA